MSFCWSSVLLVVLTAVFWQYGKACVRQKYAKIQTYSHYKKLLEIDTGYNHKYSTIRYNYMKQNTSIQKAVDNVYDDLLCSYLFNCSHYMNLIRPLLDTEGVEALNVLIDDPIGESVFFFENQVVSMLNVMYNFGKIDSVDHLWLVYMHSSNLYSLTTSRDNNNILLNEGKKRSRLLLDHDIVYGRLRKYTENNCTVLDDLNVYNDQLDGSCLLNSLDNIRDNPLELHKLIKNAVAELNNAIRSRISEINKHMKIDVRCESLFQFNHLLLKPALFDYRVPEQLLKDFAEITDQSEYERISNHIKLTCTRSRNAESLEALTKVVGNCHGIFKDVIKYIIFNNTLRYVQEVSLCLPTSTLNDPSLSFEKWRPQSSADDSVRKYSKKLNDYLKQIMTFLNIIEDDDFKFIANIFSPSSESELAYINTNQKLENTVLAELLKIHTKFQLGNKDYSIYKLNPKYLRQRFSMLENKNSSKDLETIIINLSVRIEAQLSMFTLRRFLERTFIDTDFQVIISFIHFAENSVKYIC